jgi:hypothetical protein
MVDEIYFGQVRNEVKIYHQPINFLSLFTGLPSEFHVRRTGWWELNNANAARTNGLTCLPKNGEDQKKNFGCSSND